MANTGHIFRYKTITESKEHTMNTGQVWTTHDLWLTRKETSTIGQTWNKKQVWNTQDIWLIRKETSTIGQTRNKRQIKNTQETHGIQENIRTHQMHMEYKINMEYISHHIGYRTQIEHEYIRPGNKRISLTQIGHKTKTGMEYKTNIDQIGHTWDKIKN